MQLVLVGVVVVMGVHRMLLATKKERFRSVMDSCGFYMYFVVLLLSPAPLYLATSMKRFSASWKLTTFQMALRY